MKFIIEKWNLREKNNSVSIRLVIEDNHRDLSLTPTSPKTRNNSKSKYNSWFMRAKILESHEVKPECVAKYEIIACESVIKSPLSSSVGTWWSGFISRNSGDRCSLLSKSTSFNWKSNKFRSLSTHVDGKVCSHLYIQVELLYNQDNSLKRNKRIDIMLHVIQ